MREETLPEKVPPGYMPIPVGEAEKIGYAYRKDQVILLAWDRASNCMHRTTWGRSPADKIQAAHGAEHFERCMGIKPEEGIVFEDFRTDMLRRVYALMGGFCSRLGEACPPEAAELLGELHDFLGRGPQDPGAKAEVAP